MHRVYEVQIIVEMVYYMLSYEKRAMMEILIMMMDVHQTVKLKL